MKVGNDIYTILKRNNTAVWAICLICIVITSGALFMSYSVYKESQKNIFAINDKGELVPLVKLDNKKDKLRQIQANLDYFVSLYYNLDGYTMKDKKEKVLWLVGKQPMVIIKDRDKKGYFNIFLSITGLQQYAKIDQNSWQFSSYDQPYNVSFVVDIVRVNGESKEYYKCEVSTTIEEVNRNYPYNPYGFILTNFSEKLTRSETPDTYKEEQKSIQDNNQNN